ncbi:alkaline phosphatase [Raphidiopsis curvata NIES-932]|nr:alkaline phosphatase [Raphidiopsis curvata NIES-932]
MAIRINKVGTTNSEITAFDPISKRLYVIAASVVDIYTVGSTGAWINVGKLAPGFTPASATAAPNSIAIKNGIVAVAYEIKDTATGTHQRGRVSFFDAVNGNFINSVEVGFLPDMLTFTPDGKKVLVANKEEPNENYSFDPEGSLSIIDLTNGPNSATVQEAKFNAFNSQLATLRSQELRVTGNNATLSQDLEPEYIAVSPDGLTAAITLQEANAIAFLDIASGTITNIKPLGLKNHNLVGWRL